MEPTQSTPLPSRGNISDGAIQHLDCATQSDSVLIGDTFATYLMAIDGETAIVKMEDYPVSGRKNTRVYREYLAFRLASRVGLDVPNTSLRRSPQYGRMSIQRYIHGATEPLPQLLDYLLLRPLGMRIVLFDILCGNHDRKPNHLLQHGALIIPIDFNTAFQLTSTVGTFKEEVDAIFARWFRIRNILSLTAAHRSVLLGEARRMVTLLDNSLLRACLAEIPRPFCGPTELEQVRTFLSARRDALCDSALKWWDENVAPLHVFDPEVLALTAREHIR